MRTLLNTLKTSASNALFAGFVSLAQFSPLEDTSNSPLLTPFYASNDLPGLINALFKIALSVGAILAVLRLAYAGFLYMGSADMWGEKAQAKEIIRNAIMGLLLLMSIYIILYQINPDIVSLNLLQDFGGTNSAPASNTTNSFTNGYNSVPAATQNVNGTPSDQANNPIN